MPEIIGQSSDRQATCGECGAKMKFKKSEVRVGEQINHDDCKSVITCPQCHKPIDVTSKVGRSSIESKRAQDQEDLRRDYDSI